MQTTNKDHSTVCPLFIVPAAFVGLLVFFVAFRVVLNAVPGDAIDAF